LRTFEIFASDAENGGMTAAADLLGISQSAVSQAIRSFEEAVGRKLFDRTMRPQSLTLAGTAVLEHTRAIIDRMRSLERAIRSVDGEQLPLLRIGMANTFAVTAGPVLIERIRHIARSWSVRTGATETKIGGLLERHVDFVVTFDERPVPAEFLALPIYSEPYFIAFPASFASSFMPGAGALRHLSGQLDMLRYGGHLHVTRQIDNYLQEEGIDPPLRYRFDTIDAVVAMVAAGLGWTLMTPLGLLKSASLADRIVCVPLPGRPLRRRLILAGRRDEGTAIAALIQHAAIEALVTKCLPSIAALLPGIAASITVGDDQPGAAR
jgi:DNA-binding transcriptional LysR family regulator